MVPAWACFHAKVLEPAAMLAPSIPTPNQKNLSSVEEPISPLWEGKQAAAVDAGNSAHIPEQACITLPLHLPEGQI